MLTVFARKMATVVSEGMAEKVKPMKIPMIDIGANLLDPMFQGVYRENKHESDFDLVLERAYDVGVEKILSQQAVRRRLASVLNCVKQILSGCHYGRCSPNALQRVQYGYRGWQRILGRARFNLPEWQNCR